MAIFKQDRAKLEAASRAKVEKTYLNLKNLVKKTSKELTQRCRITF